MSYAPRLSRFGDNGDSGDYWPGFVDALATLLLVIVFLLSIFLVGQFALGRALTGRDEQLAQLNTQLAQLTDELSLARGENQRLTTEMTALRATISDVRVKGEPVANENVKK